jgi:sugar transferase EpsL
MKRLFDVVAAFVLLLLSWPVMLLVAMLIRMRLGTPILFSQERPGWHGQTFRLYKFRSMSDMRDDQGNLLPDRMRLGSFGHLLRKTSLDELPQLWNVLRGDMSMVGPRPLLVQYLPRYTAKQARRHEVRPGITGWAQVNGRNAVSWEERFEMDVWYVDHQSCVLDLRILIMTLRKVFQRGDVSAPGHATMPEFMGDSEEWR